LAVGERYLLKNQKTDTVTFGQLKWKKFEDKTSNWTCNEKRRFV